MLKQLLLSAGLLLSTSLFAAENPHVVLTTSYGDIVVEAGHHADAIAATVRRVLEVQLKAAELARRDADLDGAQA